MSTDEDDAVDSDPESLRKENPSGWMVLTKHPDRALLLDTLIDAPPDWEFTRSEWSERTGIGLGRVQEHLALLLDLNVVERVEPSPHPRYCVNAEAEVMRALHRLNDAVNSEGSAEDVVPARREERARSFFLPSSEDPGSANHPGLDLARLPRA